MYLETSRLVGDLVTLDRNSEDWKRAEVKYYAYYWAQLSMMEDGEVETAMAKFEKSLRNFKLDSGRILDMRIQSYCLAHALKSSISANWSVDFKKNAPPVNTTGEKDPCASDVVLLKGN
jgi:hypothetical protein